MLACFRRKIRRPLCLLVYTSTTHARNDNTRYSDFTCRTPSDSITSDSGRGLWKARFDPFLRSTFVSAVAASWRPFSCLLLGFGRSWRLVLSAHTVFWFGSTKFSMGRLAHMEGRLPC